jgi:acetyl esterase/lipase
MDASGGLIQEFDFRHMARQVAMIDREVTPETAAASQALYAPFHEREPYEDVLVTRDQPYGPHPKQALDVFAPVDRLQAVPVVVFVHGGGFVAGARRVPGTPYQDNVGLWAVRHGMVGVTISHRLAPEHPWPAGAEDVAGALGWVREHIGAHGGDPDRIHLMGTSAGATHVASYLAHARFQPTGGAGVASASLLSGVYDLTGFEPERLKPYFGDDPARYAERSPLPGLVETPVPVLYVVAELDPPPAQRQALAAVTAHVDRHGEWPSFARLAGHNHFTVTLHLNTPDDGLTEPLLAMIKDE